MADDLMEFKQRLLDFAKVTVWAAEIP